MSLQGKDILIVDDSTESRMFARRILESAGARIYEATEVAEGLRMGTQRVPHLIILDLEMGEKSGYDFLKARTKLPLLAEVPVLVLTGKQDKESIIKAIDLGARGFILKPATASHFLQKVRKTLRILSFKSRKFPDNARPKVNFSLAAELKRVNEGGCQFETGVKLSPETTVQLSADFLKDLLDEQCVMKSFGLSKSVDVGRYYSEVRFIGVGQAVAKKIRKAVGG